jgi:transposase
MRWVPLKTVEEQAAAIVVKHREMLVGQRAQAINALRGHATEFGTWRRRASGTWRRCWPDLAADTAIPTIARTMLAEMGRHVADLDGKIEALDRQLLEQHKTNAVNRLLAEIPGVGPITATTMALIVNPANFESGRHFASWLGLTPQERSTGGK